MIDRECRRGEETSPFGKVAETDEFAKREDWT